MTEKVQKKNGITPEELLGISTIKAKRLEATKGRMPGTEEKMPIMEVEFLEGKYEGERARYGVVTQAVFQKLLETSYKDENGDIIVQVPEPDPSKPINWINML